MRPRPGSVLLPPDLLAGAARAAGRGASRWTPGSASASRASLADAPAADGASPPAPPGEPDPLFHDVPLFEDDGPTDYAERHDDDLYGPDAGAVPRRAGSHDGNGGGA